MIKKLIIILLLSFIGFSQTNNDSVKNSSFKIGLKTGASYNSLIYTNCINGLLGLTYKKIINKNIHLLPEIFIRYQMFNGNFEYAKFDGVLESQDDGSLQVVGAHDAYSLNSQGHGATLETTIKISFVQDDKISINIIPYYTRFLFGQELSETTSAEPINGAYDILTPTKWSKIDTPNPHGLGAYIGISYQLNTRIILDLRSPIIMNNYFDGNDITHLYYSEKVGKMILLSIDYYFY